METRQHYTAMAAFCRQRSKMVGENELSWVTEAELLAKLAENNYRQDCLALEAKEKPSEEGFK